MEKIVEPFTSRFGENINNLLDFNDNEQGLKAKLKILISKASDIETEVKKAELSGRKRRSMEVGSWLEEVEKFKEECGSLNDTLEGGGISKRLLHGGPVKKLKEGVEELIEQSKSFRKLVVDECGTGRERLFTSRLHGETLNQELDNVLAWVRAESNQVPIIGIHGMGGVGKTTLAKHIRKLICTDLQGTPDKFLVYWITVSQEVNIERMQNGLARNMNFDLPRDNEVEENAAILQKLLAEKKNVVLILDDVWKSFKLENIGIDPRVSSCKVIITSRLREVCSQMGCKETIKVQPLSEAEALKLFMEELGLDYKLIAGVEEVAKEMAKKCDGLPLAIITVARSMIGVEGIHWWRDALEELKQSTMGQNDMNSEVFPVLLCSYNRLRDPRLQQCFLYCSLYPEDYQIPRDELISLLISEGLMHQRDTRAAEVDQGHTILDKLVKACLLEKAGEDCVKMHDLLREMAVEITRNNPKFARKLPDKQEWELDKVSLHSNYKVRTLKGMSPISPQLSTLILSRTSIESIPDSFFASIHGLRVLNLRSTQIKMLPNSISELENLKALLLGDCFQLSYIPSLRKLRALTELEMSRTSIKRLPEDIECLVNLKCLDMNGMSKLEEIPRGLLPRLHGLQRLLLPKQIKVELEEVASFKMLEEFEGLLFVDIFPSNWLNKSPPFTLCRIIASADVNDALDYLCFFNEREIRFVGYNFKRGGVDAVSLPQDIQKLEFDNCKGLSSCLLEDFPCLCHSKDLRKWTINGCEEIESITRIAPTSNGDGSLQHLKLLMLFNLPNLIGLIKWEPRALMALPPRGTFSSLTNLRIYKCHKMKKLFPHNSVVHNLQNLEVIFVKECNQMEEIIGDDEEDKSIAVGSSSNTSSFSFPKLQSIYCCKLPNLYSICKGEMICCDSIVEIRITECPKLKRLPLFHPCIHEKPASPSSPSSSFSPNITIFPKLKHINLYKLPELESIYEEGTINCCDSIGMIGIRDCLKIKRLPFFNPSLDDKPTTFPFPRLHTLKLHNLPEVKGICSGIMICDSIIEISISGCRQLRRLPLFLPLIDGQPSHPPLLQEIKISEKEKEWWESLEWDHPDSANVLRPILQYRLYK